MDLANADIRQRSCRGARICGDLALIIWLGQSQLLGVRARGRRSLELLAWEIDFTAAQLDSHFAKAHERRAKFGRPLVYDTSIYGPSSGSEISTRGMATRFILFAFNNEL